MTFEIHLHPKAHNFLRKLDTLTRRRIRARLDKLKAEPFPSDIEHIGTIAGEKVFRVRVGDYRIAYFVVHHESIIYVIKIDKRSRMYK